MEKSGSTPAKALSKVARDTPLALASAHNILNEAAEALGVLGVGSRRRDH